MKYGIGLLAMLVWAAAAPAADELAAGGGHTCAVNPGGKTYCWGWQEQGQVGDGSFDYLVATPHEIPGAFDAVAIDAGYQHTCAVMSDGGVKCWGYDRFGQVGNGTAGSPNVPNDVIGVENAIDVGTGAYFSCALIDDGTVKCWGHGYHYQLGNEQLIETDTATETARNIDGATAMAVGGEFVCVIVDGKVKCWGRNDVGQLGRGTTNPDPGVAAVADVSGITEAVDIAAGAYHACALIQGGTVQCWGGGGRGRLGNDDDENQPAPVSVLDLGGAAVAVDAGDYHSCAILESGAMKCWGYNYEGGLGNGQQPNDSLKATTVLGIGDVNAMAAGGAHSCARTRVEPLEVWCWGKGNFGQLGDGQYGGTITAGVPVRVKGAGFDTVFGGPETGGFE